MLTSRIIAPAILRVPRAHQRVIARRRTRRRAHGGESAIGAGPDGFAEAGPGLGVGGGAAVAGGLGLGEDGAGLGAGGEGAEGLVGEELRGGEEGEEGEEDEGEGGEEELHCRGAAVGGGLGVTCV